MKPKHPLVFVPGLNCTGALFEPQIDALSATHDIIVADHGSDDDMAGIAARLLRQAPASFALAGLSMGGYVALEVMRQAPRRVSKLALLDTRASADTPDDAERRRRLIALAKGGRFSEVHSALWPRLVHSRRVTDRDLEAIVVGMMKDTGASTFIRQQKALLARADYRQDLAAIQVPTLVVVGEADTITPIAMAEEIANGIPGAQLTVIRDSGHLSTLEEPAAVNIALEGWLAD